NPDVVGISIAGESQLAPALTLTRLIKTVYPKLHISIGGYVSSMLADTLQKDEELYRLFFDSAILHEGERPFLELVNAIAEGKPLEKVPNLVYFDGCQVRTGDTLPPEDIDSLPAPDFDGLPLNKYLSPEPILPLLSSRGCYWSRCGFCTHSLAYGQTYRLRSPQKVVDDIEYLAKKYNTPHFALSDEGTSPSSMKKIAEEIMVRGLDVRLSTSIRPEKQ